MRHPCTLLLLTCLALLCAAPARAFNNPSLEWKTLKTEHFEVHYHDGAEWTARMVAQAAEDAHGPLTAFYQYEPKTPVHFVIKDTNDYANGAAYFYDNKVEIWATNLEFGLRGTTQWVRNVVTHEYAHIISIQASIKFPQWMPAIYLQAIGFESEKRPDVLQGYPNLIMSYPISGVMMPPWFAEGIAQYQAPNKRYDCWDAHRDMILRSAVLEDRMLTYTEMCFFGKNGLRSEQVYDHGFGLVNYIAGEYGDEALREINDGLRTIHRLNMDGALQTATGKNGEELYDAWAETLRQRYAAQLAEVDANRRDGTLLKGKGFMTVGPVFSPNGRRIAFLSNEGSDYAGTALHIMNRDGRGNESIRGGVTSVPNFSPDGKSIVYSKSNKIDRYGSVVNDIFVYDVSSEEEKRVTRATRASDPDFSPDGKSIVCVTNHDGTHRLMVMDREGFERTELFSGPMGTQFYNPHFSPDGKRVLFGVFDGVTRDIAVVDVDGSGFRYLLKTSSDERDARWTRDGKGIVFSSERSGIFNVYELDLASGRVEQLTNVAGGAFMPDVAPDGTSLVYAGYRAAGYGVFRVDGIDDPVATFDGGSFEMRTAGVFDECADLRQAARDERSASILAAVGSGAEVDGPRDGAPGAVPDAAGSDDGGSALAGAGLRAPDLSESDVEISTERYKSSYTPFQFYPRILVWDGRLRFGLVSTSFEILDKQALTVAGSYGVTGEFDGYIGYEIHNFFPTLFIDALVVREKTTDAGSDSDPMSPTYEHSFDFDVRYDLWLAELGMRFEFGPRYSLVSQHDLSVFWSHSEYRVNIDGREFDETGMFLTSFDGGWKYYVGNSINVNYLFRTLARKVETDINPTGGRQIRIAYLHSFDELFEEDDDFEYAFRPQRSKNPYNQYTVDWHEFVGMPWWDHSLRLRLFGSYIDNNEIDDFFYLYMGGKDGIRGYTYYSIGGLRGAMASATYRFPIIRRINRQFQHLYFRDVWAGVFAETANAWTERGFKTNGYKTSAGYELRANFGSFYVFPATFSVVGAYAFDPVKFDGGAIGSAIPVVITQDIGWSHYFTLGFGFDL